MNYKITTKYIAIKRRINPTDELIHLIAHNSNKRRYLWNKFVDEYKKDSIKFDPGKIKRDLQEQDYLDLISTTNETVRTMFCSDIPLSVFKDVCKALKQMATMYTNHGIKSELQYKSYDPFKRSFRVRTCNEISKRTGKPKGKVRFSSYTKFEFKASLNYAKNVFKVKLLEPICDVFDKDLQWFLTYDKHHSRVRCSFHHEDIKDIAFMKDMGKYYIILFVDATYYCYNDDYESKQNLAGIDLGVRNPVMLYDGEHHVRFSLSNDALNKLRYYQRKCERLQSAMDHKRNINQVRNSFNSEFPIHSKRYMHIWYKFRYYSRRMHNIRANWRFKTCNYITKKYKHAIIDEFCELDYSNSHIPHKLRSKFRYANRTHGMRLFMELAKHMCAKNDCQHIDAPDNTTRICSKCGYINKPLSINRHIFVCDKCGCEIDRDNNAAINCYKYYSRLT